MKKHLSSREIDIMQILWNSHKPLLASEIQRKSDDMTINTVRGTLRKLLDKKYVSVADIDKSGTVFGRLYAPAISLDQYMTYEFQTVFSDPKSYNSALFAAFLNGNDNVESALDELEQMIKEHRKGLEAKDDA